MITSPLKYLGNMQSLANDFLVLMRSNTQYECFYDLFCGSASISLIAIENNLAKKYILNDAYSPNINYWQQVANKPTSLIDIYLSLINQLSAMRTVALQENFYQDQQNKFNEKTLSPQREAATFAFLLNHAMNGIPYLSFNKLSCKFAAAEISTDPLGEIFAARVMGVNRLF